MVDVIHGEVQCNGEDGLRLGVCLRWRHGWKRGREAGQKRATAVHGKSPVLLLLLLLLLCSGTEGHALVRSLFTILATHGLKKITITLEKCNWANLPRLPSNSCSPALAPTYSHTSSFPSLVSFSDWKHLWSMTREHHDWNQWHLSSSRSWWFLRSKGRRKSNGWDSDWTPSVWSD